MANVQFTSRTGLLYAQFDKQLKFQVFFLDGRVICCPDPRGLILSAMALLLSEWIFLARVIDSSSAHRILIPASSLILLAAVSTYDHNLVAQFMNLN
jgi:hypothetical protein